MFKHLNPFYLDEGKALGVEAPWDHHATIKDPKHHDRMVQKHLSLCDKHQALSVKHSENAFHYFDKANALIYKPMDTPMKDSDRHSIEDHMAAATKHMLVSHEHACRVAYHDHMALAHSEMVDHLNAPTARRGAEKRARAFAAKAYKVLD
jgi:hypothetical protein